MFCVLLFALGVTIMALQVIADTVETITKKKEVQA